MFAVDIFEFITHLFIIILETLKSLIDLCVIGASVKDLCDKGDAQILAETGKVNLNQNS